MDILLHTTPPHLEKKLMESCKFPRTSCLNLILHLRYRSPLRIGRHLVLCGTFATLSAEDYPHKARDECNNQKTKHSQLRTSRYIFACDAFFYLIFLSNARFFRSLQAVEVPSPFPSISVSNRIYICYENMNCIDTRTA